MTDDIPGGEFVGRGRELAVLERRLAAARAGAGGLVLVEGEAGAGKTALAHALGRRARRSGVRVAWGACLEGGGTAPYWPWVQILHGVGRSAGALAEPGAAPESRFQVFDLVVEELRAAAGEQGLLVVVDDLHWADEPSLRLLQWAASAVADHRVLLAGLYRGRDAFAYGEAGAVLRAVGRERAAGTVALGALTPDEVAELAGHALGHAPGEQLLKVVRERCEGNPLFVLEMVRLVAAGRPLEGRLPRTVREAVGGRLARLTPDCRQMLGQASVLGREFAVPLLAAIADGGDSAAFQDLLDEAVTADVVTAPTPHTLRFSHVLTQEALYAELPTAARRDLHARAARALADTGSPEVLAHHLRQAAPLTGAEEALAATRAAGQRARDQLAYEHAAFQYREALKLLPLVAGGQERRAGLLLELARSAFRSGAVEEAWRCCREAAELGRAAGDAEVVADAAAVVRGITNSPLTTELHGLCESALGMLEGVDDPVREARVLAQLAVTTDPFAGAETLETSRRALAAAEACGDADALFLALQARSTALVDGRHVLQRLSIGERALRLGRDTGRAEPTAWGHAWRMDAFWELGRRLQLDAELTAFAELVARMKEPLWQWRLLRIRASIALYEGDHGTARELAARALEIGRRGGHEGAGFLDLVFRSHLALQTGEGLAEVEAGVRDFLTHGPFLAKSWLAEVLVGQGRMEEAAEMWRTLTPYLRDLPRSVPEWIVASTTGAHLAVLFGDHAAAAPLYDELLPYADRHVTAGAHNPSNGPVTLYLGMLATLLRDWPAAERHLRAALASCRATGSPPYEARTRLETARLLLARRPADAAGAAEHLAAASAVARRLGLGPLKAWIAAVENGTRRGVLTAREEEVAALVAEGLSNRQIATRLRLSERTAENHVTHILTKLGFDSRARIAAWYAGRRQPGVSGGVSGFPDGGAPGRS